MTINQFMTQDHKSCDEQFAQLENIVDAGNFDGADLMFNEFQAHMLKHFDMEEKVMFEEFNTASHDGCNPTGMMVMEHDQIRDLMSKMKEALNSKNKEDFLGLSENLLFIMQQHNMKEEQIMYNLADDALNQESVIKKMKEI
jgi:hemerythrin-like domain-containing protein